MPKNILLTYLYKNLHQPQQFPIFEKIVDLCIQSFWVNLIDDYETVLTYYEGLYDGAMLHVFNKLDQLYHEEPCNILLIDGDMLCTKRMHLFDQFKEYRIFGTQTGEIPAGLAPLGIVYQLNSGLRYFPAGLPENLFTLGRELAYNWSSVWAYDQYIYNAMFYAQGIEDYSKYIDPRYCYMEVEGPPMNCGHHKDEAFIVHYHSSRGPEATLQRMIYDAREMGI